MNNYNSYIINIFLILILVLIIYTKNEFVINSKHLLKLLNKCKFSVSNDETRHYLSGVYFHQTEVEEKNALSKNIFLVLFVIPEF